MFKNRSYEKELMDDLELSSKDLERNLKELEVINTLLGGYKVTLNGLRKIRPKSTEQFKIIDIGSGAGDMLRKMALWFRKKNVKVKLSGLDANQFMIDYAIRKNIDFPEITYKRLNIFNATPKDLEADIVTMNLFCHHFSESELKEIIAKIADSKVEMIIINDLHRHSLAYYSIFLLTRLFNGSYLVKNDAPLSVKRAFNRNELKELFVNTAFRHVSVKWFWAFRWQVCAFKS